MDNFQLILFDQTRSPQCSLGPWWTWQGDLPQLMAAARQFITGPNPGSIRIFTLSDRPALSLPSQHELAWNNTLEDERELQPDEAAAWLHKHRGLQLFIYNGDSDCIRHLLALKLDSPQPWFPPEAG